MVNAIWFSREEPTPAQILQADHEGYTLVSTVRGAGLAGRFADSEQDVCIIAHKLRLLCREHNARAVIGEFPPLLLAYTMRKRRELHTSALRYLWVICGTLLLTLTYHLWLAGLQHAVWVQNMMYIVTSLSTVMLFFVTGILTESRRTRHCIPLLVPSSILRKDADNKYRAHPKFIAVGALPLL